MVWGGKTLPRWAARSPARPALPRSTSDFAWRSVRVGTRSKPERTAGCRGHGRRDGLEPARVDRAASGEKTDRLAPERGQRRRGTTTARKPVHIYDVVQPETAGVDPHRATLVGIGRSRSRCGHRRCTIRASPSPLREVAAFADRARHVFSRSSWRPISDSSPTAVNSDLDLAMQLADLADAISMSRFRAPDLTVEDKQDGSPVTDADLAVETALRDLLERQRPSHAVVAEETGSDANSDAEWRMVSGPDRRHAGSQPAKSGVVARSSLSPGRGPHRGRCRERTVAEPKVVGLSRSGRVLRWAAPYRLANVDARRRDRQ